MIVMNVTLISVIVAMAVLLLKIEFPSRRISNFIELYHKSLSDLEEAKFKKIAGKPYDEEARRIIEHFDKGADEINKYFKEFKKGYNVLKLIEMLEILKLFLPLLLMFEILHIALQEFGWSWVYEGLLPGLNGIYVVSIILLMLLYFALVTITGEILSEKAVRDLESKIISVTAKYIYGFL
jgi:hypothetical protein